MIRTVIAFALLCPLSGQTPERRATAGQTAEPGSVRGVVVGAADEPLRKAEVTLRPLGSRGGQGVAGTMAGGRAMMGMSGGGGGVLSQTTDANGSFRFDDLSPGTYAITVQRNGYVRSDASRAGARPGAGSATFTVSPGQTVSGLSVKLVPHGVVAGKVTDEDGDPVAFASVQVLRERWVGGRRQYTPMNADATNDLGEYRIPGLMPGRYFLMVTSNRPEPGRVQPRPAGAVSDQTYVNLFYPGVTELSQATPIPVVPGQELRGMDFRMHKVPSFRIRGRVVDESGKPAQGISIVAAPAEGYFLGMRGMGVARTPEGTFEISGAPPGSYLLIANRGGREAVRSVGRTAVQVGNRDLDGVVVQLQPTFEISGTVRAPEGVAVGNPQITLESLEPGLPFGAMGTSGRLDANGTWTAAGVSPGRYRFALTPLPQGTYLKAVTVQGQDITSGALVTSAATGVEIQLAAKAPTVTGTVTNSEKEPVPGARVVLVPDSARRDQYWLFRQTSADSSGSFSLGSLAPGQYTAFAFTEAVEDGSWFSPEFLGPLEGRGTVLKLTEGSAETVQITVAQ